MTPKQRAEHIENIKAVLVKTDWVEDRWGNFKKGDERVKFQKTSIRHEAKVGSSWMNLKSDYIKNIEVFEQAVIIKQKRV